jgi:hypothetical protein
LAEAILSEGLGCQKSPLMWDCVFGVYRIGWVIVITLGNGYICWIIA